MEDNNPNNNLVRLDRNLTRNANMFSKFGERENLVTSLYVFFCQNNARDIFGKFRLDPEEFMLSMGYKSRSKLFEKVKVPTRLAEFKDKPAQLEREKQRLLKSNEELFDSVLGDALYMMMEMNLILKNGKAFRDGEMITLDSYQIIKHLTIFRNTKKKNKVYYDITLNEDLINNLKHFFDHINKQTFISCRESNLQNLYFFISSLKEYCISSNKSGTPTFDSLCALANVNDAEVSHRKKKLKVKIMNLLKLDPSLNFKFAYTKRPGDNYDFQPEFLFQHDPEERQNKAVLINQEKLSLIKGDIERKLIEFFKSHYSAVYEQGSEMDLESKFMSWKSHLASDKDAKIKTIFSVVKEYFPKTFIKWTSYPDGPGSRPDKVYEMYFKSNAINSKELF